MNNFIPNTNLEPPPMKYVPGRDLSQNNLISARIPRWKVEHMERQNDLNIIGVWQGVAMDSLKLHPGPPCPTLLRPAVAPPPKRPYDRFGAGPPAERAACGRFLSPSIPHVVRAWFPLDRMRCASLETPRLVCAKLILVSDWPRLKTSTSDWPRKNDGV
jgi:hypothetical protein